MEPSEMMDFYFDPQYDDLDDRRQREYFEDEDLAMEKLKKEQKSLQTESKRMNEEIQGLLAMINRLAATYGLPPKKVR